MVVADSLGLMVRLVDKIASDLPRNLDIAILRHTVREFAAAARPAPKPVRKRRRRIVRAGYWAERKRAQRARARAAKAATEATG